MAATRALASGSAADRTQAQSMIGQLKLGNPALPPVIEMSAALGDVDTDGCNDFAAGAYRYESTPDLVSQGRVWVVFGSP